MWGIPYQEATSRSYIGVGTVGSGWGSEESRDEGSGEWGVWGISDTELHLAPI